MVEEFLDQSQRQFAPSDSDQLTLSLVDLDRQLPESMAQLLACLPVLPTSTGELVLRDADLVLGPVEVVLKRRSPLEKCVKLLPNLLRLSFQQIKLCLLFRRSNPLGEASLQDGRIEDQPLDDVKPK